LSERPPSPEDIRLYRIELLERAIEELRLELHDDYYDRAQLMNEYVPRTEHLRVATEQQQHESTRRDRLMLLATIVMAGSSIATVLAAVLR
jgi:hypothetical protein